jgi:hypothetical protein
MGAHNANTHLVQPNFCEVDYVLRAVPKMRQHQLSLTWKGPYVVEKVYANHTLLVRSLVHDITFIAHVTRVRIYRNVDHDLRQEMSPMRLTAEHNQFIPEVVSKFGHVAVEKKTGDMFVFAEWVGFDLTRRRELWSPCMRSGWTCHVCSRSIYSPVLTLVTN